MKRKLGIGTIMGLIILDSMFFTLAASQGRRPSVTTYICDRTGIDGEILHVAKQHTLRVFRESAPLDIDWIDLGPSCTIFPGQSYLSVVIIPEPSKLWDSGADAMGYAAVQTGEYRRAYVFYERVKKFDERYRSFRTSNRSVGNILGHAIAHEIGHLLIQKETHTGQGLMRGHWGLREWRDAGWGALLFHREHARLMERQLPQN